MQYDFIIIGAGASGLMLANTMGKDPFFEGKTILLLDKDVKQTNDRTWSFWEKEPSDFDSIVHKKWNRILVASEGFEKHLSIAPYTYKTIRGIDFYSLMRSEIDLHTNISFIQETVNRIDQNVQGVTVHTADNTYKGKQGFTSIFDYKQALSQQRYPVLQQHFLGWFVQTAQPIFDATTATFMDFSIPQKGNTRFMYVLPFSTTEALVEYTLFSHTPLEKKEYEVALETYMKTHFNCTDYTIMEQEHGSIPMTCFDFAKDRTAQLLPIGVAGGWAKPSSGYAFKNIQKNVALLVTHLKAGKALTKFDPKTRFWYYDLLLLDVLDKHNYFGSAFFTALFKKRKPQLLFKFLNEETSFLEDLGVFSAPKAKFFLRALLKRIF